MKSQFFLMAVDNRNSTVNNDIYAARVSTSGTAVDTTNLVISQASNVQT